MSTLTRCHHDTQLLAVLNASYEDLKVFLLRKFGCPVLAEDVVQETWLRIRGLQRRPATERARAYLFRMAVNLAIDHLRSEQVRARHLDATSVFEDVPGDIPSPDRIVDYQQRVAILRDAVEELPPRRREVFKLHKFDGLSHAQIASRLGISRNMVEKHIIRGLAHCRERLRPVVP